jgi:hypothetical protein
VPPSMGGREPGHNPSTTTLTADTCLSVLYSAFILMHGFCMRHQVTRCASSAVFHYQRPASVCGTKSLSKLHHRYLRRSSSPVLKTRAAASLGNSSASALSPLTCRNIPTYPDGRVCIVTLCGLVLYDTPDDLVRYTEGLKTRAAASWGNLLQAKA